MQRRGEKREGEGKEEGKEEGRRKGQNERVKSKDLGKKERRNE